jgi:hypothetical protein
VEEQRRAAIDRCEVRSFSEDHQHFPSGCAKTRQLPSYQQTIDVHEQVPIFLQHLKYPSILMVGKKKEEKNEMKEIRKSN